MHLNYFSPSEFCNNKAVTVNRWDRNNRAPSLASVAATGSGAGDKAGENCFPFTRKDSKGVLSPAWGFVVLGTSTRVKVFSLTASPLGHKCSLCCFSSFFFFFNLQPPLRSCCTFKLGHPSSFANLSCVWGQRAVELPGNERKASKLEHYIRPRETGGTSIWEVTDTRRLPDQRTLKIKADVFFSR